MLIKRFIEAEEICPNVIITDDPMRVKMLAAHYLENAGKVGEKRGLCAYSGKYKNTEITLLSSGFGMTAAEIVIDEAAGMGTRKVIYIGECVSFNRAVLPMEVILSSGGARKLITAGKQKSGELNIPVTVQKTETCDRYYLGEFNDNSYNGILDFAAEGVYRSAGANGIYALSVLTVSENAVTGEIIGDSERQIRFNNAALIAFEILTAS